MRYKVNGSAEMTDNALVRAHGGYSRCGASPPESMVRGSSATVVSTVMCIPFMRPESNSTTPMALPFVDYLGADDGDAQAR